MSPGSNIGRLFAVCDHVFHAVPVRKNPLEPLPYAGVWPLPHQLLGLLPVEISATDGVRGSLDNADTVAGLDRSIPKRGRSSSWLVAGPTMFLGLTIGDTAGA